MLDDQDGPEYQEPCQWKQTYGVLHEFGRTEQYGRKKLHSHLQHFHSLMEQSLQSSKMEATKSAQWTSQWSPPKTKTHRDHDR
jgi:hypothetical protein